MASLFLAVFLDMVSRAFSLQALSMWVKSEYAQVAVTFLIILMAFLIFGNGVEPGIGEEIAMEATAAVAAETGNIAIRDAAELHVNNPTEIAKSYIKGTVVKCQADIYLGIFILDLLAEPGSSLMLEVRGVESIGGGFFLGGIVSTLHYLAASIVYLGVFEYVQYYLLTFSYYTMLSVFLPIGLVLRAFPFTRGAGGLIVAVALGFAFVFPVTYILVMAMMPSLGTDCSSVDVPVDSADIPSWFNAGEIKDNMLRIQAEQGRMNLSVEGIRAKIALLYLQAFFYPMVVLIVTFTFIRQTGSLFGSDLAEIGRGIIKIV